jgi:hypothetical protein
VAITQAICDYWPGRHERPAVSSARTRTPSHFAFRDR